MSLISSQNQDPNQNQSQRRNPSPPRFKVCCHRLIISDESKFPGKLVISTGQWSDVKALATVDHVDVLMPLHAVDGEIWTFFAGEIVYYPVPDFGILPESILSRLVNDVLSRLLAGKKIGMFCQGGHGRTGYVAACLLKHIRDDVKDPVKWLRQYYCKQAVETESQLIAIMDYWGLDPSQYKHQPSYADRSAANEYEWDLGDEVFDFNDVNIDEVLKSLQKKGDDQTK